MKNIVSCAALVAAFALGALPVAAQRSTDPVSDALRVATSSLARNIVAALDDMPAEKFQYKPTPAQMSVAQVALHLVEDNDFGCASLGGSKPAEEPKLTPDDAPSKLMARAQRSFDFCAAAFQQLHDSQMADMVPWFGPGQQATRARMAL